MITTWQLVDFEKAKQGLCLLLLLRKVLWTLLQRLHYVCMTQVGLEQGVWRFLELLATSLLDVWRWRSFRNDCICSGLLFEMVFHTYAFQAWNSADLTALSLMLAHLDTLMVRWLLLWLALITCCFLLDLRLCQIWSWLFRRLNSVWIQTFCWLSLTRFFLCLHATPFNELPWRRSRQATITLMHHW